MLGAHAGGFLRAQTQDPKASRLDGQPVRMRGVLGTAHLDQAHGPIELVGVQAVVEGQDGVGDRG